MSNIRAVLIKLSDDEIAELDKIVQQRQKTTSDIVARQHIIREMIQAQLTNTEARQAAKKQ